jgi:hypothetical protein
MNNIRTIGGALVAAGLAASAFANDFDLSWYTIDGGGVTFATGGDFEMGGTIGQPDAGAMSGGDFELSGGFWFVATSGAPCEGQVLGDANCDGTLNFDDIDCFVSAIIGPDEWISCAPGCDASNYLCANDVNKDGSVGFDDIDQFVTCIVEGGCP